MEKKKSLKSIIWLIILAAIFAVSIIAYINSQFTISFGFLGVLFLLAIILLPAYYHFACSKDVKAFSAGQKSTLRIGVLDNIHGFVGALLLLLLGVVSVKTLNNYFDADKHVYRNIDHHAVHFNGIRIAQPNGFVLAANSRNAFFDDRRMQGQATIIGTNDTAVSVRLTGFSRPIYFNRINSEKRCYRRDLVNTASMLSFNQNEHLFLRMSNGEIYDFSIGKVSKDSVEYLLRLPDDSIIKSNEDRFLIQGLPLNKLISHPKIQDADFAGIHIVRDVIKPLVKQKNKLDEYANARYYVEIQNMTHTADGNHVQDIRVGDGGQWHSVNSTAESIIQIPYETVFIIGYGSGNSRPVYFSRNHRQAEGSLALIYQLPIYHYIEQTPDKSFNNACITTSLNSFMSDIATVPENVLLFDAFNYGDNINNMAPMRVSYVSGPTNQSLNFLCTNADGEQRTIHAGDFFVGTNAPNHNGVSWIAGIEDFKQTSPYQPKRIKWYIILFTLALSLLLFLGSHSVKDEKSALGNTFTTIEFVAYAVTLYLVTFRWFLLWRTSVFLPVEHINYYEFLGVFRNADNGSKLLFMMMGFVALILIGKFVIRYFRQPIIWLRQRRWSSRPSRCIWIGVSAALFVLCAVERYSMPWLVITLPVLLYLFNGVLIIKTYADFYRIDDRRWEKLTIHDRPAQLLGWSVINAVCTSGLLLFIDSGFGILFFTFTLFWLSWLLHEHVTHYLPDDANPNMRNLCVVLIFILMLALVGGYKNVIGLMYYHPELAAIPMAIVGVVICCGVFYVLNWRNKRTCVLWCVGISILFALTPFAFKSYVSDQSQHTAQRIAVHFERPEDIMKEIHDDQTEVRFLNAAQNHMIIGEYNIRGKQVHLLGDHGHGYFKMQPHSRVGAMWNAQLTDISLVRFVIAEHSAWLPYLIVFFFIFMLVWAVRQPLYRRWTRAVLIQIPLLLFVQSLLIWMANTQRFVFLGQDFPMISINSRLTLVYYFSLIIIWVVTAIYSKVTFTEVYEKSFNDDKGDGVLPVRNSFRYEVAKKDMIKIIFIMLFCMGMGLFAPKGKSIPTLRLESLMEQFGEKVELVNTELKNYQDEKFQNTRVRRYNGSMTNLKPFMQNFNKDRQIDSLIFADFPFGLWLWKKYIDVESSTNNTRQVLYACLDHNHQLQLRSINVFSHDELPQPKEDEWRGSIIAVCDTATNARNRVDDGNLHAYRLPADWFSDGKEKTIVSCIGAPILGSEPDFVMQRGIRSAAMISPGITVVHHSQNSDLKSVIQQKCYLARNIMLNGHRTMLYPMGESLYWISQFAAELKSSKNKIKETKRDDSFNNDVELTLIPDLNSDLYSILRNEGANKYSSVIVANGDGEVWAMPYFNRNYHLNPNDHKQISIIVDSLELYGLMGSQTARRLFGNQNLMSLPFGPGSSQKPLVWTAVASVVDYNHWDGLRIEPYRNNWIDSDGNRFVITHFNGKLFKYRNFMPLRTPDERNGGTITLRDYMSFSSNVYNALMVYIGSFPETYFGLGSSALNISSTHNGESLFASIHDPLTKENYINRFPLLSVNGNNQFTLNSTDMAINDQTNSILNQSMYEMFFRSQDDSERFYTSPAYGLLATDAISYPYAFIERSRFNSRQGNFDVFMERGLRSTAIGASVVWSVTPWKMAESFGRMASLNYNLHLNIGKQSKKLPYRSFEKLTNGYWKARPEQLKGMSNVLTEGTARDVGRILHINSGEQQASNKVGNYYIYAKTGTIGSGDQHCFGVIISNIDLVAAKKTDLERARYVMLYFTFSDNRHTAAYAHVIQRVMESEEFEQYMNQ